MTLFILMMISTFYAEAALFFGLRQVDREQDSSWRWFAVYLMAVTVYLGAWKLGVA